MKTKEEIKAFTDYLQTKENREILFNEDAILADYQKNDNQQSLAIKILSIFGGILASLAFIGFLMLAGLYDSDFGLIFFGVILLGFGIGINKVHDKIIIDTLSISAYIIGFILLGFGLEKMEVHENIICCIFILISLISLCIVRTYILTFISVLMINGAIITLLVSNDFFGFVQLYTSCLAILLAVFYVKEAKFITYNSIFSKLYDPIRIALVFSFLSGLIIVSKADLIETSFEDIWITSAFCIISIIYLLSHLFEILKIHKRQHKTGIYILTVVLLLPTILSPAISGAILIILLSFLVNYKTSLVIGIVAFIYFVSQYYYDLHFTLLTKSILLFSSGILFLGLYLLTHKKLKSDEKI
ncbi:DUF4401 domain-containing protein [Chryseobacterium sp.]|uniref:DUF4401 domain-containing protein n=1 Tax=Chryseobacterium sp. TaxID=1871047 RepID=UPI00289F7ACE|nr:DUF4401 domain-containing protein [Chryseobacterium sp.]